MRRAAIGLSLLVVLAAASPKDDRAPDDLIRAGNAAVLRGDFAAADKLYEAAEDRTQDPGLVAFNKGYAHFHRREYDKAEQHYTRALDDRDAPPDRRANALYNRGVCQLRVGGLGKLRSAIDSFERCLAAHPEAALAADARHNLELAKLLWVEARAKERTKPLPGDPADDQPPQPLPPRPEMNQYDPFGPDGTGPDAGSRYAGGAEPGGAAPKGATPRGTDQTTGGKGHQPVLSNADKLPDWTDRQVREYLDGLSGRLARERRGNAVLTAPAERPAVKDW